MKHPQLPAEDDEAAEADTIDKKIARDTAAAELVDLPLSCRVVLTLCPMLCKSLISIAIAPPLSIN